MISRIRFLLQESPLFRKMFLAIFMSVFLTFLFTGITNMSLTRQLIRNDNHQLSTTLTKQIAVNLNHRLNAMEDDIFTTFVSSVLNRPWPTTESIRNEGGFEQLKNELMTQQALENIVYSHKYVDSLLFIDPLGDYSYKGRESEIREFTLTRTEIQTIKNQYGAPLWLPMDRDNFMMARALFDTSELSFMGILVCVINSGHLESVISESSLKEEITFFIVDQRDHVVLYPHKNPGSIQFSEGVWIRSENPRDRIIEASIKNSELQLLMVQSYQSIDRIFRIVVFITLAAGFIAVGVVGLINYKVSSRFYQNVQTLLKGIEDFGKDSHTIQIINTGDEIQQLSVGISSMANRIEDLIENVSKEKITTQKAQYDALQARYSALMSQVNPHFLYNALESISCIAQMKDENEISRIAVNLGRMLRTSINNTQTFTKLSNEIEFVRDLIETYKLVYDFPISFLEEIPDEFYEIEIPTFLLLPLVENAIIHGLLGSVKKGILRISAGYMNEKVIWIKVSDNGRGIPENKIQDVLKGIQTDQNTDWEHTSIGIPSIIERLSIVYGTSMDFKINAGMDGGTVITVIIPGKR